jgi:hypothetical protein
VCEHFLHQFAEVSRNEFRDVLLYVENLFEIRKPITRKTVQVVLDEHQRINRVLLLVDFLVQMVLVVFVAHKSIMEFDRLRNDFEEHILLSFQLG